MYAITWWLSFFRGPSRGVIQSFFAKKRLKRAEVVRKVDKFYRSYALLVADFIRFLG